MALVRRALARDAVAVEWLVERLARMPALVRAKNARMGSPMSAEEVDDTAQDAMAAVWAKLGQYEGRSTIDTWICGFAVHEVHKAMERKFRSRQVDGGDLVEEHADPAAEADEPDLDPRVVHEALERLGPPASDVIRMRQFEELEFDAIARRTGTGESTVKARYYRGLVRLKEILAADWRKIVP